MKNPGAGPRVAPTRHVGRTDRRDGQLGRVRGRRTAAQSATTSPTSCTPSATVHFVAKRRRKPYRTRRGYVGSGPRRDWLALSPAGTRRIVSVNFGRLSAPPR
jgi:hypothetical protein